MKHRVGLVGAGGIAEWGHLPGIRDCPDLELVALCDIDPGALKAKGDKFNVAPEYRFSDYNDLINCDIVDAVDITTPNDVHFEIAMAVAKASKPYALEKPVTMNADQSAQLLSATGNLASMVCFSYRFKAAVRFARDIVSKGQLGVIHHVNTQYFQAWGGHENKAPLLWRFQKDRAGSGALGDLGCHAIDLVRFILNKEYLSVCAHNGTFTKKRNLLNGEGTGTVDVDDFSNFLVEIEDDISGSFQITRYAYGRNNYQRIEIYGSKGALVYKLDEEPGVDSVEVCIGDAMRESFTFAKLPTPGKHKSDQMQSFADILNGNGDGLAATIKDGHKNQVMVDAVLKSADECKWIVLQ